MTDHLHYRLLGQTVDDAAGEAFDKVGRLLGLPYPGGPAIMKAAAGGRLATTGASRAPGWARRSTSASAASRPRRVAPSPASSAPTCNTTGSDGQPLPAAGGRRAGVGFQDSVVEVLATKTVRAAEAIGARTIVVGGGVAANSVLRERIADGAAARGIRWSCRGPGCAPTTRP